MDAVLERQSFEQLLDLLGKFGTHQVSDTTDVMMEAIQLLPEPNGQPHAFVISAGSSGPRLFESGADAITAKFEHDFNERFAR
jgi:hypothetical protein